MRTLVVSDDTDRHGGYVVERLRQLGARVTDLDRDAIDPVVVTGAVQGGVDLVVLLGSHRSAHDPAQAAVVAAESTLLLGLLDAGVAAIGICYGAQLAARALGGHSYRADEPEVGWRRVDTDDPELCPEGPWAQFHRDVFVVPPSATALGSTWAGPQAFIDDSRGGRVVAWQFHPEALPETVTRWAEESAHVVREAGLTRDELARQTRQWGPSARLRAFSLVDSAVDYLGLSTLR